MAAAAGVISLICAMGSAPAAPNNIANDPARRILRAGGSGDGLRHRRQPGPPDRRVDAMAAMMDNQEKVQPAFKSGGGVGWGDQATCLFCATARFFPQFHKNSSNCLPALDGVVDKLQRGANVAVVGCGHGWSTVLWRRLFPICNSRDTTSIQARSSTRAPMPRTRRSTMRWFESEPPRNFPGKNLDFVTFFDCQHRHGQHGGRGVACPAGAEAGRHLDGRRADGRRPARRRSETRSGGSITAPRRSSACRPRLSQEVGAALGAQAGETKLREVITSGGFKQRAPRD